MYPQHSHACYLDSGSAKPKDYTYIKGVLDDALTGFAATAGPLKVQRQRRGSLSCTHKIDFPCLKQSSADNEMEAWYAIHHMREFVRDRRQLMLPSSLQKWGHDLANCTDADLRLEFYRIQQKLARIEHKDVCTTGGLFFYGLKPPSNKEIETRLLASRDDRPFNTLEGVRPFPPKP